MQGQQGAPWPPASACIMSVAGDEPEKVEVRVSGGCCSSGCLECKPLLSLILHAWK